MYITPRPIKVNNAIFVLNFTCRPLRKIAGKAAHNRSVMIDRTASSGERWRNEL